MLTPAIKDLVTLKRSWTSVPLANSSLEWLPRNLCVSGGSVQDTLGLVLVPPHTQPSSVRPPHLRG
jgi:hypothetical protein